MTPLLERDSATGRLAAAASAAVRGAGSTVLVTGEAGIGKTSLLEHFARGRDGPVFWGGCEALATPRPLGPLYDFAASAGPRLKEALRAADRAALFAAVLDEATRGAAPGVLVIEDLHWADEATLDFVKYAGRRIHRLPALLLLSCRHDESAWRRVRAVLADLPAAHLTRIDLQPLSLDAVREASAGLAADARRLHAVTGGNPFFLAELLRARDPLALPESVQDAVLRKVGALEDAARDLLERAALFPRQAEIAVLARVRPGAARLIDDCVDAGLLVREGGAVRFRHELARTAVESGLAPSRAAELHQQILDALSVGAPEPARIAQLAHHAGLAGDVDAILRWCPLAADQASARGARREAAAHCRDALAHAGRLAPATHAALLRCHAEASFELSDLDTAVRAYREAADLHRRDGNTAAQARCLADLAMPLVRSLRNAEADAAAREALALARAAGDEALEARVLAIESYLRMLNRDYRDAIAAGERALALAGPADRDVRAQAYKTVGSATIFLDYARGCALVERSFEIARELEDGGLAIADAYLMVGTASGELHQFEAAERYIDEGLAWARTHDLDRLATYMEAWRALCHVLRGEWDAAGPLALAVLAKEPKGTTSRVMALLALGRLRTRRGDPGAMEALDEALELAQRSGTLQRVAPARAARAEAAWLAGDLPRAAAEARAAYPLAVAKAHPWFMAELGFWLHRAGEDVDTGGTTPFEWQARGAWREAAAAWERMGCPYEQAASLAEGDEGAQREALAILEGLAARPLAERVRRDMRAAGHTSLPRGPIAATRAHPAGLTRREVEVLQLLAQQLTTREIAARLSRSGRTVDHHVESLCAKLGAAGRADAVRTARELRLLHEK